MSHEIRTPLNSILGFSEQLEKVDLSGEQRKQLVSVQSASQILLSIVNDILDLSKLETGKLNIQSFPFFPKNDRRHCFYVKNPCGQKASRSFGKLSFRSAYSIKRR